MQALWPATLFKRDFNTGFLVNLAGRFLQTAFFIEHLRWYLSIFSVLIKNNVRQFLLKRFGQSMLFTYISRNHSNTFSLINLQKTKTCPKKNTAAKSICSDVRVLAVEIGFRPVLNVYFNGMEINAQLYLSSSLYEIPL